MTGAAIATPRTTPITVPRGQGTTIPATSVTMRDASIRPIERADRTRQSESIQAHVAVSPIAPINSAAEFTSQTLMGRPQVLEDDTGSSVAR